MEVTKKKVQKRKSLTQRKKLVRLMFFVCFLLLCLWVLYDNVSIQTTLYEIQITEEYADLDDFTIVQISDLHNARFGKEQTRLLAAVAEQEPDIIAVTGDLIDSSRTNMDVAMAFMEQATEIAPVYYVTGNHEGWIGDAYGELKVRLEEAGVYVLDNAMYSGQFEGLDINIAGVSDPDMPGNNIVLTKQTIQTLMDETTDYTILLSHRPELFDTYVSSGANLVLAGHYHGGQFRIPFIGGVIAPGAGLFPEYAEGTFTENHTTMVVSRGLGNSVIPVRINNRPEVVVVKLQADTE
ncbi:MAG: metallophosphoesterase [Lachnospiraceae bacterium]|nr:metallophosphoesterase [Lachnospiraceae bacterium]